MSPPSTTHRLYESRLAVTAETICSGIGAAELAEDRVRRQCLADVGPELLGRAKIWWEEVPYLVEPNELPRRWYPWMVGQMFPAGVRMVVCKLQVVDWYERNPLIYGFPDRSHDWPDFRCDGCDRLDHPAPNYYCPTCGEVFDRPTICGHTLEMDGPEPCTTEPIRPLWRDF